MASYPLISYSVESSVKSATGQLLQRRRQAVEVDFPLTREDLVNAIVPPRAREALRVLTEVQCETISNVSRVFSVVPACHGNEHAAVLEVFVTPPVYVLYRNQTFYSTTASPPPLDLDILDDKTRERLTKWVNIAVREKRICDNVQKLVGKFISDYCRTTGELQRRWPGLRVVFNEMPDPWPERMREAHFRVQLKRWDWPRSGKARAWYEENMRKIDAADAVLAGASLMKTDPSGHAVPVSASIQRVLA